MIAAARAAALAFLLAAAATPAFAAEDNGPRDAEFGVVAHGAVGLERNVAMYQWQRDGDGYRKGWSDTHVDSRDFVPGHDNPPDIPLQARRWLPRRVLVDGRPVARDAVDALAEWRDMRPDFSAVPGNLSATFQPEGDGLGSAANPAHPEIGDLRISWRELRMPASYEGLVLRDGRWELDPAALARRDRAEARQPGRGGWGWMLLGALAASLLAGAWILRRRQPRDR